MKLGRLPRRHDPRIPHYSALVSGRRRLLAPAPAQCDYISALGNSFGMMLNNTLGDCTCAAVGHARQVWTGNSKPPMETVPDSAVQALYSAACGYVQGQPNTDQGGDEQTVLTYVLLNGIQTGTGGVDKLTAFVEVDPANMADVRQVIYECGVCYIGFDVPQFAMNTVGQLWDVQPGEDNPTIVGGHAVILSAYDEVGPTCITWGAPQKMTWAFFERFTDEAYALADSDWIKATGMTPAGLTMDALEAQMSALRQAS